MIVYDYDKLGYGDPEYVHDLPADGLRTVIRATGYRHVLVNGQVTIEDDRQTNTMAGQLLRGGRGR